MGKYWEDITVCEAGALRLEKGSVARFFHPMTFGTMEVGIVLKVVDDIHVEVKFDRPDHLGRRVFVVSSEHAWVRRLDL